MKTSRIFLGLLVLGVLLITSCKPSVEDVEQYLVEGEHEKLYSFLSSEIKSGNAKLIWSEAEPNSFELGLFGFLVSGSELVEEFAPQLMQNIDRIELGSIIDNRLWQRIIDSNSSVPIGFHEFLLTNFLDDPVSYKSIDERIIDSIKEDSIFAPIIKTRFRKQVILHVNQTNDLYKLADLGHLTEPKSILQSIKNLESKVFSLGSNQQQIQTRSGVFEYRRQLSNTQAKIDRIMDTNSDLSSDIASAYTYRGYMVALIDQLVVNNRYYDVYEVRSYNRVTSMLVTRETSFGSKGTFSLRVTKTMDVPMTLKQSFGGFRRNIPLLIEVTDKEWKDYQTHKKELDALYSERSRLSKLIDKAERTNESSIRNLDRRKAEIHSEIKVFQGELQKWVKENV